jgi:hypothetical protein
MTKIINEAKDLIRSSNVLKGELMAEFNIGERTVINWINRDDLKLTSAKALQIISKHTGMKATEILAK